MSGKIAGKRPVAWPTSGHRTLTLSTYGWRDARNACGMLRRAGCQPPPQPPGADHATADRHASRPLEAQRADPTATVVQPGQRRVLARSAILTLGPIVTSPRTARVSAMAQLSQWGRGHLADDTAAIASMPAGTPVGLGMILTDSSVVVEVFDRAPGSRHRARRRPRPSPDAACTWSRPCRASGAGPCCVDPRWSGPRSRREQLEASEPGRSGYRPLCQAVVRHPPLSNH
jgi:hypothetical protein